MPSCFLAEVLTPEKSFFCSEIQSIILPCADGYMSVQKMHASEVIAVVEISLYFKLVVVILR